MSARRPELVEQRDLYASIGSWQRYLKAWRKSFDADCGLDNASLLST